jgi:hypothetical protein
MFKIHKRRRAMADITEYIEQIGEAVYGEEVRGAIMNSITEINNEVNKLAFTATLEAEDWAEDENGYITQIIENERILDTSTILISMHTDPTGINLTVAADYANIYHAEIVEGGIKFYILSEAAEDIPINYLLLSSQSGKVFFAGSGVNSSGGGALVLRGITIAQNPTKTIYKKGETLSTIGMVVRARYSNGSVADVTAQCTISDSEAQNTAGQQTITVSYTEDGITSRAVYYITVYELSSIAVTTQPTKRAYKKSEALNTTGMIVTATYTDGRTANVTADCTISAESAPSTIGSHDITVTYEEDNVTKTTTFPITVYELSSIAITTPPTKRNYRKGASISTSGMVVTATYSNGTTAVVTGSCTLGTSTAQSTAGNQGIVVSYTEDGITKTTTLTITVYELSQIAVTTQPSVTTYYTGATISKAGMVVTATYTDNHTENVSNSATISPTTAPANVSSAAITVSYTEDSVTKTTTYNITVYEFDKTLNVSTKPGASVRVTGAGENVTKTADSNGDCTFTVHHPQTYTVAVTLGQLTGSDTVAVNAQTASYSVTIRVNPSWKVLAVMKPSSNIVNIYKSDDGQHYSLLYTYSSANVSTYYPVCICDNGDICLVPDKSNDYIYSKDGGITWNTAASWIYSRSGSSYGSVYLVKKINDWFYFIYNNSSSSYVYVRTANIGDDVGNPTRLQIGGSATTSNVYDYSSDGTIYVAAGTDGLGTADRTYLTGSHRSICYGNGIWVALEPRGSSGETDIIRYSSDKENWYEAVLPCVFKNTNIVKITYKNGLFIACDAYGRVIVSADGATWTAVNDQKISEMKDGQSYINCAAGDNEIYVIYKSSQYYVRKSADRETLGSALETDLDPSQTLCCFVMAE